MTLIKCPSCGQTVLSLASVCPQCSTTLASHRFPVSWEGTLAECRRCGLPVSSRATVCHSCGARRPARRSAAPAAITALVVVLAGVLAARAVISRSEPLSDLANETSPDPVLGAKVVEIASTPPPVPAIRPPREPLFPVAVAPAAPAENGGPGAPGDSAPAAVDPPPATRPRWVTDTWANVRVGPGDTTSVVVVLPPGRRVDAGAATDDGWQPVYVEGVRLGYVARFLLTSRPPASEDTP